MSKLTELFEVITKHKNEKGVYPRSLKLRKELLNEIEKVIEENRNDGFSFKKEREELSKYGNYLSYFNGIGIHLIDADDSYFDENVELIAIVNDQYAYFREREREGDTVKWRVCDLTVFSWDKPPEFKSPFSKKLRGQSMFNFFE